MVRHTCVSGTHLVRALRTVTVDGTAYEEWTSGTYVGEVALLVAVAHDEDNSVREVAEARSLLGLLTSSTSVSLDAGHRRTQSELNAVVREIVPLMVRYVGASDCDTWLRGWEVRVGRVLVPCTYRDRRPDLLRDIVPSG